MVYTYTSKFKLKVIKIKIKTFVTNHIIIIKSRFSLNYKIYQNKKNKCDHLHVYEHNYMSFH
jgi:hypothetical protein